MITSDQSTIKQFHDYYNLVLKCLSEFDNVLGGASVGNRVDIMGLLYMEWPGYS